MVHLNRMRRLSLGAGLLATVAFFSAGCQSARPLSIPEWHAMASVVSQGSLETRVSPDGIRWSGPNFATNAGGARIPADQSIPPGIGSDNRTYLLVFFSPGGQLNSLTSVNGLAWTGALTHGAFAVDANSRPAVAHDFRNNRWVTAFRTTNNHVTILPLRPAGPAMVLTQATSAKAPALSWVNDQFVLAFHTPSGTRVLKAPDGARWPATAVGATVTLNPIVSAGAPYITNSIGTLYMATATATNIDVFSSTDGLSWTRERTLARTGAYQPDPAISGPLTEQVIALPMGGRTQTWLNNGLGLEVPTGAVAPVSLAFGPRDNTVLQQARIVFNRVTRVPADPGREDLTLRVTWMGVSVGQVRAYDPWQVLNVTKNQVHTWNEGRPSPDLPTFTPMIQSGESLRIQVTGDDGSYSRTLTSAELRAGVGQVLVGNSNRGYDLTITTSTANP
jgi:hypothetical protein